MDHKFNCHVFRLNCVRTQVHANVHVFMCSPFAISLSPPAVPACIHCPALIISFRGRKTKGKRVTTHSQKSPTTLPSSQEPGIKFNQLPTINICASSISDKFFFFSLSISSRRSLVRRSQTSATLMQSHTCWNRFMRLHTICCYRKHSK